MSKPPFVSVIIVNYNGRTFIGECLNSVLQSEYPSFEIVVVDNASTDGSVEFIKKLTSPRIRLIENKKNLYFTGGSNLGARKARGKKLIFLNSDTVVDKDWMKELVVFTKHHNQYLVQPEILSYHQKNTIDNVGGRYTFFGFGYGIGRGEKDQGQYDENRQVDYVNGTCFMIDKGFFWKLGGFDEWYKFCYEDIDLNLRAKKQEGRSWCCPKSIVYHKGSLTLKKNISNEFLLFTIRKNRLRTLIKNFTGWELFIRLFGLLSVYLLLIIQELLTFRLKRTLPTLKSVLAVFNIEMRFFIERLRLREINSFVKKSQFSLLDLGCGDGLLLELATKNGIDALGVDKHPPFYLKAVSSPIESLKLDKKFDVVTIFHVLEHVNNPENVLRKIKTFLKKDGVLVIEIPLVGNLTERFLQKGYFAYHDKTHVQFFTKKEIFKLLDKTGFVIKKRGATLFEFPLTVLTTSFKQGFFRGLMGAILFLPLKILTILGVNEEIIRLYCVRK